VGGVDRGNEAGARRGRGLGLGHLSRRGHRMRKPVWRVSLHPFGRLAPPFPLPSPKLELVPQTPRSGGNELDSDGGRARFGGGKARSEGRGRRGRIVN